MEHDPDGAEEYEEIHVGSTIGWGGMIIGPDGIGRPMPEVDALLMAIPGWVGNAKHLDQAVRIYMEVLDRPEAAVRRAAVTAIGDVARRHGRLPHRQEAREAVTRALHDVIADVRAAAGTALRLIDTTPD